MNYNSWQVELNITPSNWQLAFNRESKELKSEGIDDNDVLGMVILKSTYQMNNYWYSKDIYRLLLSMIRLVCLCLDEGFDG